MENQWRETKLWLLHFTRTIAILLKFQLWRLSQWRMSHFSPMDATSIRRLEDESRLRRKPSSHFCCPQQLAFSASGLLTWPANHTRASMAAPTEPAFPEGVVHDEGTFVNPRQFNIYWQSWIPASPVYACHNSTHNQIILLITC